MAGIGGYLQRDGSVLRSSFPPLEARWLPHVGPGTPLAVTVGVLIAGYGPSLASRLGRRALLWSAWAAAMAWTWSLALVDGWQRGVAGRLTASGEYLTQLSRFDHLGPALRTFTGHILLHSPHNWATHIAGHPAGAVLTFVGLDRIGLSGGAFAAVFVITAGTSLVVAVLLTLRLLTGEDRARAAAPFVVLTPGAVWVGVSADGYFAAVAAWALALLAVAATRTSHRQTAVAGLGSGVLLGAAVYLSYGLALLVIPAAVVLLCARTARPVPYAVVGAAAVAAVFTAVGFDWWQAYGLLRIRYFQGYGGVRPYSYWFFGDLATLAVSAGPASAAGLRRVLAVAPAGLREGWRGAQPWRAADRGTAADQRTVTDQRTATDRWRGADRWQLVARWRGADRRAVAAVLLPCGFLLVMLAADLSGMSKAETERIWLPFTLWLPATAAFLPRRDHLRWLLAQALVALLVNHLLLTAW
ncbi:hypothetical protein POF50_000445 [Streptomyces sp. SL13]|uniref:Integral membrane protein n=1 Tax=Streptantibioticus silvisoli TaxID=2705255 RepID=A0AA90GYZ7_9ACTN|nr:hypothetical protein [Streptantibioticus silvisoli]MDI5967834.1 hypothetical protein [Streptantibioticus silvisoli]